MCLSWFIDCRVVVEFMCYLVDLIFGFAGVLLSYFALVCGLAVCFGLCFVF